MKKEGLGSKPNPFFILIKEEEFLFNNTLRVRTWASVTLALFFPIF